MLEEARRNKWTFEEAIEHKVFTVIGQGDIDFPLSSAHWRRTDTPAGRSWSKT